MNANNRARAASAEHSLADLSDGDLLASTRNLVGRSNQLVAALLAHLGEVEARGIHRTRACASLYTYCIYELRLSEDEAFRRVTAARLTRRFPALLEAVASGELHLTGLLMLGPHLTEENLFEVLARAKHRTKKEIAGLVRVLDPLPDVPPRIEPLGPAPARLMPAAATWERFVRSTCPVRELAPGDRPRDFGLEPSAALPAPSQPSTAPARLEPTDPNEPTEPQRYKVQFTASEEYVKLVEEAKALLSSSAARPALDELHLRAMRAFVAALKKQKHAVGVRTPSRKPSREPEVCTREAAISEPEAAPGDPRQRGRHVPAAVRRAVFERDAGRCAYVDATGQRCRETHALELHHLQPFARGGEHTDDNLGLRCRAHNALAAEQDFGRELIEHAKDLTRHESSARSSRLE